MTDAEKLEMVLESDRRRARVAERLKRAEDVADLAMRLACSPTASLLVSGVRSFQTSHLVAMCFDAAEEMIAERDRRAKAAREEG